jgi:hypothetical protein
MGNNFASPFSETLLQLILRATRADPLVQTEADWHALGTIAARMLFWCGGAIYACRCEGNEMRFALQVAHSPVGAMAHHISGAYAIHLRQSRGVAGSMFRHYIALPLSDEIFLDDLVLWLHRPSTSVGSVSSTRAWTADDAYLSPNSIPWISTDRVLKAISTGAPWPATYRRRKSQALSSEVIELFTRRPQRASRDEIISLASAQSRAATHAQRPSIEVIGKIVAQYCGVSYDDMLSSTRKRAESKARVITTVLATRNGATAAAAARLFNRSRSTLIEQVEHYRATQPEVFAEAEALLEASLSRRDPE